MARLRVYKTVEYGYIAGSQEAITQMGGQAVNRKSNSQAGLIELSNKYTLCQFGVCQSYLECYMGVL